MSELKKQAIKELEKRTAQAVLIRRGGYVGFLQYTKAIFKYHYKKELNISWWDELLAKLLMSIYEGKLKRLIIEMPPRHGKTEKTVRLFSSYIQGLDATKKFQYATYGATLSIDISAETKEIIESQIFRDLFPMVDFSNKLNLKSHWKLTSGGGFLGTSVGGATTGMGADIIIGDDLLKATEAHSKAFRDSAWGFYSSSMLTRLEGIKGVILIMQRLHDDDVVGRAIKEQKLIEDGGVWTRFKMPIVHNYQQFEQFYKFYKSKNQKYNNTMKDEFIKLYGIKDEVIKVGDFEVVRPAMSTLNEKEYGLDFVIDMQEQMSDSDFKMQYFQDTEAKEAGYFKEEDFTYVVDSELGEMYKYILVDNAESLEATADDRGIVVVGKSENIHHEVTTIVLDGANGKWSVYETCEQIIRLMIEYPNTPVFIEGAGGGITLTTVLKKEIMIHNTKAQIENKPLVLGSVSSYKPDNRVSKNSVIMLMATHLEHKRLLFYKFMDSGFLAQIKKEFLAFNPEKKHNTDNCIDPLSKSFVLSSITPKPYHKEKIIKRRRRDAKTKSWRGV